MKNNLELPSEIQDKINKVVDAFDAAKIHKVMKHLNWKWFGVGVPSEYNIRQSARDRLISVWVSSTSANSSDLSYCESGGIRGIYHHGKFELLFILTSAEEPY